MRLFNKPKTLAWLAALSLLAVCLFLLASVYIEVRKQNLQQWSTQQLSLAKGIARGMEGLFSRFQGSLNHLAGSGHIIEMDQQGREMLASFLSFNQGPVRALTRIDQTGRIIHTWPPNPAVMGQDVSFQEHNAGLLASHEPVVSEVFEAIQGYRAVAIAVPVFQDGAFKGCLSLLMSFEAIIESFLGDIRLGQGEHAWVLSQQGQLLYTSAGGPGQAVMQEALAGPALASLRDRLRERQGGTAEFRLPGGDGQGASGPLELVVFHPISLGGTFWSLAIAAPEEHILAIMRGFTVRWLLIMAFLAGTLALGSYYLIKAWAILAETRKRHQAEEALRESERRFRAIFDSSFQFIGLLAPDGKVLEANRAALEFAGLQLEDVIGRYFWDTRWWRGNEEQRQWLRQAVAQAAGGSFVRREVEHQGAGGARQTMDFSLKPVRDNQGRVVMLIPEAREITDRKNMAEELKANRDRLRKAQQMAQVGNWEMDLASQEMWWSEEAMRIFGLEGLPPESLGIKALRKLVLAEDLPRLDQAAQNIVSDGLPLDLEFRFRRYNHEETRHAHSRAELVRGAQGEPAKIAATVQDVSERKRAEEDLRLTQFCFDNASVAIFLVDRQARILKVNHQACHNLQYTPEELCSLTIYDIDPVVPRGEEGSIADSFQGEGPWVFETVHRRKDGTTFPVEIFRGQFVHQGERFGITFVTDISERKRAEQEKQDLHGQLLQAQKMEAIGRLAGGVAHDFNNMLSVIMGYSELLTAALPPGGAPAKYLSQIADAAARSRGITRQLLAFSRKQIVEPQPHVLNELISGTFKTLSHLIGENMVLQLNLMEGLWRVKVDASQVDQILVNLAVNARDAMPQGGKLVIETANVAVEERYRQLHPGCDRPGDYVLLSVSDTGMGMDRETMRRVFEPFFTTKDVGQGTGLGLATVHGIVTQNQGFVNVYSEPGHGTCFRIYLPRLEGEHQGEHKAEQPGPETGSGDILLVEDDDLVRGMASAMLKELGYEVAACKTPREALRLCRESARRFDLLLTDVIMPEMNGKELSGGVRELRPGIAVLYMSGYSDDIIAHHGVLEEGVLLLPKPFNLGELAAKVKRAMG
ncbi:MAG: PAS domain S-box protein [Desulfarculus sp.]|nr:PAS domain S-box protein [Desulfarculus sp.]